MSASFFEPRLARHLLLTAAGVSLLVLGCRPEPATTTPDAGTTASTAGSGSDSGGTAVDSTDAADESTEGGDGGPTAGELSAPPEGDTEDAADGGDGADEADSGAGETETAEGTTVAAATNFEAKDEKKELPKPIYKASGGKCQKTFAVGEKVKNFKLPSVDGKKNISPSSYRGRVVLLNFWGTWCKPCLEELPKFDRIYRKYRNHGLTLVAVATDEEAAGPVQDFIDKHKLAAKVALDGEDAAGAYNRPNFPFSFLIDETGKIVASYEFVDDSCLGDLEQAIRTELEN
ncbi:MAG: TlpA family protein disulfide reductase [Myxococcales bacterium]|nr:TlpA family protein disulfide reductase [Myxococcales bacterium]